MSPYRSVLRPRFLTLAHMKVIKLDGTNFSQMSGLTSTSPLFSPSRVSETLTGGYFALLGTLSADPKGLLMIERWRIINMFYHIIELKDRVDLVQMLLGNMDFSLYVMGSRGLVMTC